MGEDDGVYGPYGEIPDTSGTVDKPDEITVTPETDDVIFIWISRDTTDGGTVTGRLVAVDVPPLFTNHTMLENVLDVTSENEWGFFGFPSPNPEFGWMGGSYRFEAEVDGELIDSLTFDIEAPLDVIPPEAEWTEHQFPGTTLSMPAWEPVDTGDPNRAQVNAPSGRSRLIQAGSLDLERAQFEEMMIRESRTEVTETIAVTVCGNETQTRYLSNAEANLHIALTTWPLPSNGTGYLMSGLGVNKDELLAFQAAAVATVQCHEVVPSQPTQRVFPNYTPPPGAQQIENPNVLAFTLTGDSPGIIDFSYGMPNTENWQSFTPETWAQVIGTELSLTDVALPETLTPRAGLLPDRHYLTTTGNSPDMGPSQVVLSVWQCPNGLGFLGFHMGPPETPPPVAFNRLNAAQCP